MKGENKFTFGMGYNFPLQNNSLVSKFHLKQISLKSNYKIEFIRDEKIINQKRLVLPQKEFKRQSLANDHSSLLFYEYKKKLFHHI